MDNLSFPTTNVYTKNDIKRVQTRLLAMAKAAADILDRHNIKYFITFGTLLGAVRHSGFIPWDDDIDLFLFDDEYEEAISYLEQEMPDDTVVHNQNTDPIYWAAWSKIRDVNSRTYTSKYPDDNAYKYTGVNVDLYRLKRVARGGIELYRKKENIEFLIRKHASGILKEEDFHTKMSQLKAQYEAEIERTRNLDMQDEVFSFVILIREIEIHDILPLRKYRFEDWEFWGPNHPETILRQSYGDYMRIPEYRQRKPNYDWVKFI